MQLEARYPLRRLVVWLALTSLAEPASSGVLQLRAAQLAAGIDAWTGGWFSSRLSPRTP